MKVVDCWAEQASVSDHKVRFGPADVQLKVHLTHFKYKYLFAYLRSMFTSEK